MILTEVQNPSAPDASAGDLSWNGATEPTETEPVLHQRSVTDAKKKGKKEGEGVGESENKESEGGGAVKREKNGDCLLDKSIDNGADHSLKKPGNGECQDGVIKPDNGSGGEEEDPLSGLHIPRTLPNVVAIKKAIPAHCFVPNVWFSIYYMIKDFVIVAGLYFAAEWSFRALPLATQLVITPAYWLIQSVMYTAIFVVGHDGGHGSFSQSRIVNDLCGNLCHAFLFCPYFMWRLSHRNHHKNTGNIDKEEVYYPIRRSQSTSFYNNMLPGFGLGLGWFVYLYQGYRPRMVGHYNPFHPMFKNHLLDCLVTMTFLAAWLACLHQYWAYFGLASLVYHWVVPTLGFGSFIVIITFLHHSDEGVPWYSDHLWNYVRGQLSSVDRNYGWCHNIIHNIGTHQIHHLFPIIPHYHLEEATASFRKAFPDLICKNNERIFPAFYKMFKKYVKQSIIKDSTKVHVYR